MVQINRTACWEFNTQVSAAHVLLHDQQVYKQVAQSRPPPHVKTTNTYMERKVQYM